MRSRLSVTVTDVTGSTHYSLSQIARRTLVAMLTVALTAMLVGGLAIYVLRHELSNIEVRKQQLETEQARLEVENEALNTAIRDRSLALTTANAQLSSVSLELNQVSDDLTEIETLIGLRPDEGLAMLDRLDTASQTAQEKMLMLQSIPGGRPVEGWEINSPYGMRAHPVSGKKKFHYGVDLKAEQGAPVFAAADGIVDFAAYDEKSGFGNLLVLVHHFGFVTYYGHLDGFEVEPGEFVEKGQVVAYTGSSGRATGPHLHFEIRRMQRKLDPTPFLDWDLTNYEALFMQETHVPWDSLAKAVKRRLATTEQRLSQRAPESAAN